MKKCSSLEKIGNSFNSSFIRDFRRETLFFSSYATMNYSLSSFEPLTFFEFHATSLSTSKSCFTYFLLNSSLIISMTVEARLSDCNGRCNENEVVKMSGSECATRTSRM
jgi:hypothetical protein